MLVINAINLIDGMDGLAGSIVALAGSSLFVMSLFEQNPLACLLLAALVGATLGFLAYNIHPASIFLGDTGSMSLGFVLSVISVHSSQKSYALFSMLGAMFVMGLPIFDLSMAVVRRFLSGKSLFGADQHHIHHLLLRRGFTQKQSVYMLVGAAILLEIIAFISIYADDRLAAFSILLLVPLGFIAVKFLGYQRIIEHARRSKVLRATEDAAFSRLKAVEDFQRLTISTKEDFQQALDVLMPLVRWRKCEVIHKKTVWVEFSVTKDNQIHIQDLHDYQFDLGDGWGLTISQLQEDEVFSPHDRALQQLFASILRARIRSFSV